MKALMYHYVQREKEDYPFFRYLHIDNFRKQLDHLEKTYNLIERQEFLDIFKTGEIPDNAAILTFDDGLKDHYDYVLPEFQKRGLWGAFYIPALPYTHGKMLDVHKTHILLGRYGGAKINAALVDDLEIDKAINPEQKEKFENNVYKRQTNDDDTQMVKQILNYYLTPKTRAATLDKLFIHFGLNEGEMIDEWYLSREEIAAMQDAGMIIGAHSVTHPVMSTLNKNAQEMEITQSFAFLEDCIPGLSPKSFCYPYGGAQSFTKETEEILDRENCLFSYMVDPRDIEVSDIQHRPQAIPRYDCNQFPYGKASLGTNINPDE